MTGNSETFTVLTSCGGRASLISLRRSLVHARQHCKCFCPGLYHIRLQKFSQTVFGYAQTTGISDSH